MSKATAAKPCSESTERAEVGATGNIVDCSGDLVHNFSSLSLGPMCF